MLLLLLAFPILASSFTCNEFIDTLSTKLQSQSSPILTSQEHDFLEKSAPSAADFGLGNKAGCLTNPEMIYRVGLRVSYQTLGFKSGVNHGMCLPIECEGPGVAENDSLIRKFYSLKQWKIEDNETLELYHQDVHIGKRTFMYILTILLFSFFILMTVSSTIYLFYKRRKDRLHNQAHPHIKAYQVAPLSAPHSPHDTFHTAEPHDSPHHHHDSHDIHDLHIDDHTHHEHEELHKQTSDHWIFHAFDLKENWKILYQTAKEAHGDENLEALDFLMTSTVYYCIYANIFGPYSKFVLDQQSFQDFFKTVLSKIMISSEIIGEYFFVMDGFMGALRIIPLLIKKRFSLKTYFWIVKQKLFVSWPLSMMAFLFYWQLTPRFFTGPMGFNWQWEIESCDKFWWTKALFIDNLTNYYTIKEAGGYCMPLLWYTVAEFQMFLVGILVLALYMRHRKSALVLLVALYIQGFSTAVAAFYQYDLTFQYPTNPTLYEVKFKWLPWKRWENYFLGYLCAILYYEYNNLNKKNIFSVFEKSRVISYLLMIFGTALSMFLVFFLVTRDTIPGIWTSGLEHMWHGIRIIFIGLSTILAFMPMLSHRSFWIKKIFSCRIMQILTKLSLNLFIYHQGINVGLLYHRSTDIEKFSHGDIVVHSIIVFAICQAMAMFFYLTLEKPWNRIIGKLFEEKSKYHQLEKDKKEANRPAPLDLKNHLERGMSGASTLSGTSASSGGPATSAADLKKLSLEIQSPVNPKA